MLPYHHHHQQQQQHLQKQHNTTHKNNNKQQKQQQENEKKWVDKNSITPDLSLFSFRTLQHTVHIFCGFCVSCQMFAIRLCHHECAHPAIHSCIFAALPSPPCLDCSPPQLGRRRPRIWWRTTSSSRTPLARHPRPTRPHLRTRALRTVASCEVFVRFQAAGHHPHIWSYMLPQCAVLPCALRRLGRPRSATTNTPLLGMPILISQFLGLQACN